VRAAAALLLPPCGCASARGARENEVEAIPLLRRKRETRRKKASRERS
jgi:hypothetical protein